MTARGLLTGAVGVLAMAAAAALAGSPAGARVGSDRARAAASGWWTMPAQLTWYWQLQGKIDDDEPVAAYDVDGFETSSQEVAALHAQGKRVICYIDAGTAENWRPDYGRFPKSVLGRSNGWPGERWIDIRELAVIEPIMAARFGMCAEKGFDAVEPDNIEAFANRSGFPITAQEQLAYNEWVAEDVHGDGMAVLQKNDAGQAEQLEGDFDGALTEQCNQYRECASFAPYLAAGKPVLNAEYHLARRRFCTADASAGITGARFNLALNGRRYEPCW